MSGARLVVAPVAGPETEAVLPVCGELDLDGEALIIQAVDGRLGAGHRKIILDCSRLMFCDSRGLNALLAVRQQVQDAGGTFVLARVTGRFQSVLTLVDADQIFTIAPTVAHARLLPGGAS
ncbi:STAS domain-containing protein [Streptomyces sp. CA-252508]|uniref:STAS domain-containing protein n=1 Tax=Streptomyces sp. CA-252508 TaxID=3418946 RepID=UPI003D8BAC8A